MRKFFEFGGVVAAVVLVAFGVAAIVMGDNGRRNVWVTETALTTALNTSYMAEQLSLFGIVVGVALLLAGIGFGILAIGGALRTPDTALTFLRKRTPKTGGAPVHA